MPVQIFPNEFTPLSAEKLAQWATIPPAIAGDVMNRQNVMAGRISPLSPGMTIAGQARTCLLYTSPSPRDAHESRMPSSA